MIYAMDEKNLRSVYPYTHYIKKKKDYNSGNICPHRSTIPLQPIQILLNSNGEYFFNPHTTSCCMDGCVDHFFSHLIYIFNIL